MQRALLLTTDEDVKEISELCRADGIDILESILQRRTRPDAKTFLGKGKMEEVKSLLETAEYDLIVVNGDLRSNQHYNLETYLGILCMDRIGVILQIFTSRAQDRQAKLQVELAKLMYDAPMIKEWVNRRKAGEHPGFLSGGEYSTEGYLNFIHSRMNRIFQELGRIESDTERRSSARKRKGFRLVSLCGHTNAGKSSLMSVLSEEEVLIQDVMFSTLSTTTRRVKGSKKEILISDTIGFLQGLPPYLIDSFKGTLNEIKLADLVLLVLDGSDDETTMLDKINSSFSILFPETEPSKILLIVNKVDKASPQLYRTLMRISMVYPHMRMIPVSVLTGQGLDVLRKRIDDFFNPSCSVNISIPLEKESASFLSWLHDNTEVKSFSYGTDLTVDLLCHEHQMSGIRENVLHLGGSIIRINPEG